MKTDAIVRFMQLHYTDEKLAALLAHAEDGKLCFSSCCCFIGVATSKHSLRGHMDNAEMIESFNIFGATVTGVTPHLLEARNLPFGEESEHEFFNLGHGDDRLRRANLIPLIKQEMARREALSASRTCSDERVIDTANEMEVVYEAQ